LLYAMTFGGFVGFASFLTTFFNDAYYVSRVTAGDLTTVVVVAGSFLRPVGGWLSDRMGGYRVLVVLLAGVGVCVALVGTMPSVSVAVALLFLAMALLGMGNGAVFQLVPQRFPARGLFGCAAVFLGGLVLLLELGTRGRSDGTWLLRSAPGSIPIAHRSRGSTTKVRPERPYHSRLSALAVDSTQT
jgi:MFS transporter, NNP family, nitrate/nitrite transporter